MPRRRPGHLTDTDRALWKAVTADVTPLRPEEPAPVSPDAAETPDTAPASEPPGPVAQPANPARRAGPPPLAQLDRRLRQRLARGAAPVDDRIDLHGLTQAEAHFRLTSFLAGAQARGHRLVLVITGKGRGEAWALPDERGVLRRLVPQWLALPEFRRLVLGFEPANRAHGGEGALYVRLRRARRTARQ